MFCELSSSKGLFLVLDSRLIAPTVTYILHVQYAQLHSRTEGKGAHHLSGNLGTFKRHRSKKFTALSPYHK